MKNYIFTKSSTLLSINKENVTEYDIIHNTYGNIDWMFPIPEDGIFSFSKEETYEVKAGDIVYIMYPIKHKSNSYEREVIIVSNKELYNYYVRREEQEKEDSTDRSDYDHTCSKICEA